MNTFFLRPPKIFVPYLNKSLKSILSEKNCSVTRAECEEHLKQNSQDDFWENIDESETGDHKARLEHPKEILLELDSVKESNESEKRGTAQSSLSRKKKLQKDLTKLLSRQRKDSSSHPCDFFHRSTLLQEDLNDPLVLFALYNEDLKLRKKFGNQLNNASFAISTSRSEQKLKGDIIVCIRDEFRAPAENLVRAYAVNSELLQSSMEYFRNALHDVPHHDELSQSVQVSLYVQKELWEWLLHFVKVKHKQTRDGVQPIVTTSAIPLFATAVLLGVESAKSHIMDFLRKNWAAAVKDRNRAWEHVTENCVELLATELNPDYFEQCADPSDWLVERLYGVWVQEALRREDLAQEFFPFGTSKHIFMCNFCQRWMTPQLAKVLPCCSYLIVRRADGKIGYAHSRSESANFQERIDELKTNFGTNRAMLWYLYGLLNAMKCEECNEYFQLCELSHCRHHPYPSEQCAQRTYAKIYPCCNQLANSADTQKSTGCSFRDHKILLDKCLLGEMLKYRRMMTYQRFIWSSPRKTADVLNDPACPFSLAQEIRNAVQELTAASWNSSRPLWSNQDCLRLDEKKGMQMLKEYFLAIGNVRPVVKDLPNVYDTEKQDDKEEKDSKDSFSARLLSAQNSAHISKLVSATSRTGPYSARNRHIQNLVLPAYRGVYTRIHDEWKAKVEKIVQEEKEDQRHKEATSCILKANAQKSDAGKSRAHQASTTVLRKPEVQKIPLRKVVKPLKPLDRQERIRSHTVLPRTSDALLGLSQRTSKSKLQHRKSKQKVRRNRTRKLGRISRPSFDQLADDRVDKFTPTNDVEPDNGREESEVSSRCSDLNLSPTIDNEHSIRRAKISSARKRDFNSFERSKRCERLEAIAKHYFLIGTFPSVVNVILYESAIDEEQSSSPPLRQEKVPKYAMKLIKHFPQLPDKLREHYSARKRMKTVKNYEESLRHFINQIKQLRYEVFYSAWKRYQQRQFCKYNDRREPQTFTDANHEQRYKLRLHRIFRYLEDQQTDAFTQPIPSVKPDRFTRKHAIVCEILTEAEKMWKKRARRLISPSSPEYPSLDFEDEEEEEGLVSTTTT